MILSRASPTARHCIVVCVAPFLRRAQEEITPNQRRGWRVCCAYMSLNIFYDQVLFSDPISGLCSESYVENVSDEGCLI